MKLSPAQEHVMALLEQHGPVRYNEHFYRDGDAALWSELCDKFGVERNDGGEDSPPVLVEVAVDFLQRDGLVELRELPELMGDGNNDYEINLTPKGREFLASR